MNHQFKPVLLKARINKDYLNPKEILWVTLLWQNQGEIVADKGYRFFLRGKFGHQRKLEEKQYDFFTTAGALPKTTTWKKGDIVAVTLKWDCNPEWAGTYRLSVGMLDENEIPRSFTGAGNATVFSQGVGSVNSTWNLGRPWVAEHAKPIETKFNQPIAYGCEMPADRFTLQGEVCLELGEISPVIYAISDKKASYPFAHAIPCAAVHHKKADRVLYEGEGDCKASYQLLEKTATTAVYQVEVFDGTAKAAEFEVLISLKGRVAAVTLQNRVEYDCYELLELRYATLAEMREGNLLDFWGSGRLIPIKEATPAFFEKNYDVRNAAVLYDTNGMLLVESLHIDSKVTTGILSVNQTQLGIIGGAITSRVKGEGAIPGIWVESPPSFTIELADLQGETPDWKLAAKLLRRGIQPNSARDLYRNTYFYKQLSTWGPLPDEHYRLEDSNGLTQNLFKTVTFAQIAENVRKFSNLTDHIKQIIYVTGWQKGGFDNAFPDPYDAEERCGGLAGLRDCLKEIRSYHALSGLHDNFDDISSARVNDFDYTAIDERGEKWKSWVWAAGMTYIMGLKKYADSGEMQKRIKKMMELLPLAQTYHIDVLTAEVCRYDFDPLHPASAQDSFEAKMKIVEEFNKYGMDITSEMLTHAAVGKIGFALHNRLDVDGVLIPGDCFVPLVQMIYHGTIGYCNPSRSKTEQLWGMLLGGQTFYEEDITGELCVSRYYSNNVPAMLLYDKKMLDFTWNGSVAAAVYEDDSYVKVDFATQTYYIVIESELIAQNFTTFFKGNSDDCYLAYSFDGGLLERTLPQLLAGKGALTAVVLTEEGEGDAVNCSVEGDKLLIEMPPMVPVKITVKK